MTHKDDSIQRTDSSLQATAVSFRPHIAETSKDTAQTDRSGNTNDNRGAQGEVPRKRRPPRRKKKPLQQGTSTNTDNGNSGGTAAAATATKKNTSGTRQQHMRHENIQPSENDTIMELLQKALVSKVYECAICCDVIKAHEKVFEDVNCWAIFHLNCVREWAKRSLVLREGHAAHWRCPSCQSSVNDIPAQYKCWCAKVLQPETNKLQPHSCGQTCGKTANKHCPHPCLLPCHPGPCLPCTQLGPRQECFCGKHARQLRCTETDYTAGSWTCEETCAELMPCDKHSCTKQCHPGLCGSCTEPIEISCFCGREQKKQLCKDLGPPSSGISFSGDDLEGYYQCSLPCKLTYDCGIHKCQKRCHIKSSLDPGICPLSPKFIDTCHCGKAGLKQLNVERANCHDEIPSCGSVCDKKLNCGHNCRKICHTGPCPECQVTLTVPCQCGSTQVSTTCQDASLSIQPSCTRVCRSALSCARHVCPNVCCSGYSLARQRLADRPKRRYASDRAEDIEAEHICTKICSKTLRCGNHSCGALCHSGPCSTCLAASFEDLSCHCGRTTVVAPVPCGTKPPRCEFQCARQPLCGHPSVEHACHLDDVQCPRCPYLVTKACNCGQSMVKNQPCWKSNVSCGKVCGNLLHCQQHTCKLLCHAPGECQSPCQQACGRPRTGCGHACLEMCHTGDCPQDVDHPCTARVDASCACGTISMKVQCNNQSSDPDQVKDRVLPCTDFCLKVQRDKKLSAALGIAEDHKAPQPTVYDADILEFYKEHRIWCDSIEKSFLAFYRSPDKIKNFKPMKVELRAFTHALSEVWQFYSESMDEEPKRNVQIMKTANSAIPISNLAQASTAKTETSKLTDGPKLRSGSGYNAFVLFDLKFGLLIEEVQKALDANTSSNVQFQAEYVVDEIILKPQKVSPAWATSSEPSVAVMEAELYTVKPQIKNLLSEFGKLELCWLTQAGEIAYSESKKYRWSQVGTTTPRSTAATKALPAANAFAALALIDD